MSDTKKIDAKEIIEAMHNTYRNEMSIDDLFEGCEQVAKQKMSEEEKQKAIARGTDLLKKFEPMIINLVDVINDPDQRKALLESLSAGNIGAATKKDDG